MRVLTSPRIVDELANGTRKADFEALLRRVGNVQHHLAPSLLRPPPTLVCPPPRVAVPFVVPDAVVTAASNGVRDLARQPPSHAAHVYIASALNIEPTLCHRLQLLSPSDFENLLHPVFKGAWRPIKDRSSAPAVTTANVSRVRCLVWGVGAEDEIVLIIVGGILGAAAGLVQLRFGWGGPSAVAKLAARRG